MVGKGWGWAVVFFQVAAVDLDGTLTSRGGVSVEALDTIDRVRRNGLRVVLVTGRIGLEFGGTSSDRRSCRLVGARNRRSGRDRWEEPPRLAAPVERVLDDALAERGVPFQRGEALLAIDGEHAATVAEVIGLLGLDCQIVRNRAAFDGAAGQASRRAPGSARCSR